MLAMHPAETVRKDPGEPERKSEATMNAPTLCPTPPHRGVRRVVALVVAVLLAALAFGVGLPWMVVDAPPQAETLWAREIQSRATAATSLVAPAAPLRSALTLAQ